MRTSTLVALILLGPALVWAAQSFRPLAIKTGLWETTYASQVSGAPPIPPEALARMTLDQRAKLEAAIESSAAGGRTPTTRKSCVTKERLNKENLFADERTTCTRRVLASTGSKLEMRVECVEHETKTTGTVEVEAPDSEHVKGSVQMTASDSDRAMNVNSGFSGKWLGPDCGAVK